MVQMRLLRRFAATLRNSSQRREPEVAFLRLRSKDEAETGRIVYLVCQKPGISFGGRDTGILSIQCRLIAPRVHRLPSRAWVMIEAPGHGVR